MLKTSFQKLILAIPLRAVIAANFAMMLGMTGVMLPSVFLHITIQDSSGTLANLVIDRMSLSSRIDLLWTCAGHINGVLLPPYWLSDSFWNTMFRCFPVIVGFSYLSKYSTKKKRDTAFALMMAFLVLYIALSAILAPEKIICRPDWQVTFTDYSISWFSFIVPITSLLLGGYALQKESVKRRFESSS